MSETNDTFNPFDPTGMFKTMRDTSMESWSRLLIDFVNSEPYAKATAVMLDTWLGNSLPFRKAMEGAMKQTLGNLQMPTREDVSGLAERLTQIERRLDDLEATLEERLPRRQKNRGQESGIGRQASGLTDPE
jgi:hypothetical protein